MQFTVIPWVYLFSELSAPVVPRSPQPLSHGLTPFGLPMARWSRRSTVAGTVDHKSCLFPLVATASAHWMPFFIPADRSQKEEKVGVRKCEVHSERGTIVMASFGVNLKSGHLSLSDISC
ncbi:hypothetical protein CgunFtcFv8_000787 [Champsocephalus gunnari]|uniref:Uncharacterized protein n=1 Tax=Champsocephalus gunnari TaxID=52237 RepID=A0AAN8HPS2_CHAGU|nr:hypothetical protein CgunFtcFv8_000787 [Champsocephalus gunnari]